MQETIFVKVSPDKRNEQDLSDSVDEIQFWNTRKRLTTGLEFFLLAHQAWLAAGTSIQSDGVTQFTGVNESPGGAYRENSTEFLRCVDVIISNLA